jgi:hypothetical protein
VLSFAEFELLSLVLSFVLLPSVLALLAVLVPLEPRLSVTYQPDPLKTIPAGWNTRRTFPSSPQRQTLSGSSLKL